MTNDVEPPRLVAGAREGGTATLSERRPSISVVVPTFERRASLARLLEALEEQDYPHDKLEVIVVDDGSNDGTIEWLRTARPSFNLRVFRQPHAGPAAARNHGVAEAEGDLILFLDDDVVPDPTLVGLHVAAHRFGATTVVCGPMLPPDGWRRPAWIRWEEAQLLEQYRAMGDGIYRCSYRQFFTANASLRRNLFLAAGGFDTGFSRAEDVELGYRLDRLGMQFVFEPAARVWHYPDRSFAAWLHTPYRYGQAEVVMHREKGSPVLGDVFWEFHRRHPLSRVVVRSCVGSPIRFRAATFVLSAVVRVSDAAGVQRLAAAALSGLFALHYWQGVSDALGGPRLVWRGVAQRGLPLPDEAVP